MLDRFISHLSQQHLLPSGQRVLLAVSGGIDSSVLAHLAHSANVPFAIAHCNFHLRPGDCDRDELFVRQLADCYGVPVHVAQFDTQAFARQHSLCIEDAARQLRYDYFFRILRQEGYAAVWVAHHRDDSAETFFINLLRGTGLAGLHGILPRQGLVVRPLLPFGRDEIDAYTRQHHLSHVEDSTNALLDYRRNQVRHQLVPLLRSLQPAFDHTMQATIAHLQATEQLYLALLAPLRARCMKAEEEEIVCDLQALADALSELGASAALAPSSAAAASSEPNATAALAPSSTAAASSEPNATDALAPSSTAAASSEPDAAAALALSSAAAASSLRSQALFELLRPYGFNAATVADICCARQSGRRFYSPAYEALLDRQRLLLRPRAGLGRGEAAAEMPSLQVQVIPVADFHYDVRRLPAGMAAFDADQLRQPVRLRRWQSGDRFQPLGMERGTQLLSDYFTDHKCSLIDKERQWLLVDADDRILWLVGRRTAHPVRLTPSTRHILLVTL